MLQRRGRVPFRALQRQFDLDHADLADLPAEIVEVLRLAVDQGHTMLAWTGDLGAPAAPLLALPLPDDRYPPFLLTPQQQRQKTVETLLAMLLAEAARQPVLCIVGDLRRSIPQCWNG
jgi:hypothetical protein